MAPEKQVPSGPAEACTLARIAEAKASARALILAHSYQTPEIQRIADFVGDSLEMCRAAAASRAEVLVICGVRFMAETAALLAPGRLVILPEPDAGCPLADSMTAEDLELMKAADPSALPVVYVNSSLELKAGSYSVCTSANAVRVVESVPSRTVIFGPDRNLGLFVARRTGKAVSIFQGSCPPHARADLDGIRAAKDEWPDAEVLVHPETPPEAWDLSDHVLGTGGMIARVSVSKARRFIIGTEEGMVFRLGTLFPGREFRAAGSISCPNMKKITPGKVATALETLEPAVRIDPALGARALAAVERMTAVG